MSERSGKVKEGMTKCAYKTDVDLTESSSRAESCNQFIIVF